MTVKIKWQNPPPSRAGRPSEWDPIREALKAKPGKWALVRVDTTTGSVHSQRRPGFEFTTRALPDYKPGHVDIYARYVGDPEA